MLLSKGEFCVFNQKSKCDFLANDAILTEELILETGHKALLYSLRNYFVEMVVDVYGECLQIRPVNMDYVNGVYYRELNILESLGLNT